MYIKAAELSDSFHNYYVSVPTPPNIFLMQITGNAEVWKLYSDFYKDGQSEEEKDKVVLLMIFFE